MACASPNSQDRPNLINSSHRHHLEYISEQQNAQAFAQLDVMRHNRQLTDVILVVAQTGITDSIGRNRFAAHRAVLAASSPYFHTMFTSGLIESQQQGMIDGWIYLIAISILEEIKLFDIDEDALSSIIDFCYTSRIVVDETNVMSLLLTARYLQMNEIEVGIHQLTNG